MKRKNNNDPEQDHGTELEKLDNTQKIDKLIQALNLNQDLNLNAVIRKKSSFNQGLQIKAILYCIANNCSISKINTIKTPEKMPSKTNLLANINSDEFNTRDPLLYTNLHILKHFIANSSKKHELVATLNATVRPNTFTVLSTKEALTQIYDPYNNYYVKGYYLISLELAYGPLKVIVGNRLIALSGAKKGQKQIKEHLKLNPYLENNQGELNKKMIVSSKANVAIDLITSILPIAEKILGCKIKYNFADSWLINANTKDLLKSQGYPVIRFLKLDQTIYNDLNTKQQGNLKFLSDSFVSSKKKLLKDQVLSSRIRRLNPSNRKLNRRIELGITLEDLMYKQKAYNIRWLQNSKKNLVPLFKADLTEQDETFFNAHKEITDQIYNDAVDFNYGANFYIFIGKTINGEINSINIHCMCNALLAYEHYL